MLLMTFLVSWFLVLMQFLWQYVDDIVGKGMNLWLILKLIYYTALHVLNLSVPLGVLLASLMTFGKLGEDLELLSMKAAGVPLWRIMKPLMGIVLIIAIGLFTYLNFGVKHASVKVYQILFSARYSQPELDIPEGIFFSGISGYSLYVTKKDHRTGRLEKLMIYDNSSGFENARIVKADSGRLTMDKSRTFLMLTLHQGESFQNLREQSITPGKNYQEGANVPPPYIKEKFKKKQIVIPFDANFELSDDQYLRDQFVGKTLRELAVYSDSMKLMVDSLGLIQARQLSSTIRGITQPPLLQKESWQQKAFGDQLAAAAQEQEGAAPSSVEVTQSSAMTAPIQDPVLPEDVSVETAPPLHNESQGISDVSVKQPAEWGAAAPLESIKKETDIPQTFTIDSLLNKMSGAQAQAAAEVARGKLKNLIDASVSYNTVYSGYNEDYIVNAQEKHRKVTFPVACILFFLVGAPLGGIIRKGGIGMPVIAAVFIFILYYVLETFGLRAVSAGTLPVWFGMWLAPMVIFPLGVYLTIQASVDSATLNTDAIGQAIKEFFVPVRARELYIKELILAPLDHQETLSELQGLQELVRNFDAVLSNGKKIRSLKQLKALNQDIKTVSEQVEKRLLRLKDYPDGETQLLLNRVPIWPKQISPLLTNTSGNMWRNLLIALLSVPLLYKQLRTCRTLRQVTDATLLALDDTVAHVRLSCG